MKEKGKERKIKYQMNEKNENRKREREEWEIKSHVYFPSHYPSLLYIPKFSHLEGLFLAKVRGCARGHRLAL